MPDVSRFDMDPDPPSWLKTVCDEHHPISVDVSGTLVCSHPECTPPGSMAEYGFVSWTPDHMARMIHAEMFRAVQSL